MDREALEQEVDQIWAEAYQVWRKGIQLWLPADEEAMLLEVQARHQVQDELEGMLTEYLDKLLPDNWEELSPESRRDFIQGDTLVEPSRCTLRRDTVCLTEIRVEMLSEDRRRMSGNDLMSRRLANLMNNNKHWVKSEKKARVPHYGIQWVYRRKLTKKT